VAAEMDEEGDMKEKEEMVATMMVQMEEEEAYRGHQSLQAKVRAGKARAGSPTHQPPNLSPSLPVTLPPPWPPRPVPFPGC